MALVNAHNVHISGSTLTNIEGDYIPAAPGERGIIELSNASCHGACHDSLARHPPPRCLQGTRASILQEIRDWIAIGDERILWLSGPAGSGKSAIAQTIAEVCADNFTLAASFFFTGSSGRDAADRLVATIAHQVAIRIPHKRVRLGKVVEDDLSILHKPLQAQFYKLLHSVFASTSFDIPFTDFPSADLPQPSLIVIDGLDECKGDQSQREVVAQIGKLATDIRTPFRFLIVSRPEPQIRDSFDNLPCKFHRISLGDKHHDDETNDDVYTFLRHSFDEIYNTRKLTMEEFWPGHNTITGLVWRSGGSFIYAKTVVKYVGDEDYHPVKRLAEILATPPGLTPFAELDNLYSRILGVHPNPTKLREVLIFVCLAEDQFQHVRRIELLLQAEEGEVMVMLRRMQSIIDVSDPENICCYHKSFTDFLRDEKRAGSFFIDWLQGNSFITQALLGFLKNPSRYARPGKETKELRDHAISSWWTSCRKSGYWYNHPQLLKDILETLESYDHPMPPKFNVHGVLLVLEWISLIPEKKCNEASKDSEIQPGSCDSDLAELQLHISRKLWEFFLQTLRKNSFRRLRIVDATDVARGSEPGFVFFCWEDGFDDFGSPAYYSLERFVREPENLTNYNLEVVHGYHKIFIQCMAILQCPLLGRTINLFSWHKDLLKITPGNQEVLAALKQFDRSMLRSSLQDSEIELVHTWLKLSGVKPYGIWRKHRHFDKTSRNMPYKVPLSKKVLRFRAMFNKSRWDMGLVDKVDTVWCDLGVPRNLILISSKMSVSLHHSHLRALRVERRREMLG